MGKKTSFRRSMAWLHTWTGLVAGWVLYFVFVTGSSAYFIGEISAWMKPERPLASERPTALMPVALANAQSALQREVPTAPRWSIYVPGWRTESQWRLTWPNPAGGRPVTNKIDPATGQLLGDNPDPPARATGGGLALLELHYKLHYLRRDSGIFIVGIASMLMLLAILTGVVTHKKIFQDFFTFRPWKGQRSWLDAHNLASVLALPFFLMITYSGLLFFMQHYMPAGLYAAHDGESQWVRAGSGYFKPGTPNPVDPRTNARFDPARTNKDTAGPTQNAASAGAGTAAALVDLREPLAYVENAWGEGAIEKIDVIDPGRDSARIIFVRRNDSGLHAPERLAFDGVTGWPLGGIETRRSPAWVVQDTFIDLHRARFADSWLRGLFFASGLLGCAMIATGLILWTVKRRQRQQAGRTDFGFRLVEVLNIGTIAGLPVGIAAHLWANRLLPLGIANRRDWEMHAIFIAWGSMLLWAALLRPAGKAWRALLGAAAAGFGLLPVLNALTSNRHLGVTLPAGEWGLAGVDLVMLALGAFFAAAAVKTRHKRIEPRPPARNAREA
ncbi:MAG: PepSY-associated TM helix domain-containing protein [Burkholderiaceae bacterium]